MKSKTCPYCENKSWSAAEIKFCAYCGEDITEVEARAEGCYCIYEAAIPFQRLIGQSFRATWDIIYSKRGFGWEVNPWVWVVEFEMVTAHD